MSPESSEEKTTPTRDHEAVEHVAEAHRILSGLRQQLDKHPDLDKAIAKLEMALSVLTTRTGGML
ncbi:MAG: hypothetical protein ABSD63_04890 [Candidatus Korobacteraceae bacterium]|jgi:hypothetical protein